MRKSKRRENMVALALIRSLHDHISSVYGHPVFARIVFSFMRYNPYMSEENEFVGFLNYKNIFDFSLPISQSFWNSFRHDVCFCLVTVPALIVIPLALGIFD